MATRACFRRLAAEERRTARRCHRRTCERDHDDREKQLLHRITSLADFLDQANAEAASAIVSVAKNNFHIDPPLVDHLNLF